MKISKEIKVAIIVTAGIVSFFIGFNFLKSKSVFTSNNTYYVVFEHSNGLKTGTLVTVNGVSVGLVEAVALEEKNAKVRVTLSCSKDFSFSKNSKAELYSSLLGSTGLQIIPAFDDAPKAKTGDTLKASVQLGLLESLTSRIEPTQLKINNLLTQSDTTLAYINLLLNENTINNLQKTMYHLSQTSVTLNRMLATNEQNLNQMLTNFNQISENLSKISDTLVQSHLGGLLIDAKETLQNIRYITQNIENGKGSLGKLLNDEGLYKNLNQASKQLELLLQDLRLNPKRYVHFSVFGRKAQPYEATSEEVEKILNENKP